MLSRHRQGGATGDVTQVDVSAALYQRTTDRLVAHLGGVEESRPAELDNNIVSRCSGAGNISLEYHHRRTYLHVLRFGLRRGIHCMYMYEYMITIESALR